MISVEVLNHFLRPLNGQFSRLCDDRNSLHTNLQLFRRYGFVITKLSREVIGPGLTGEIRSGRTDHCHRSVSYKGSGDGSTITEECGIRTIILGLRVIDVSSISITSNGSYRAKTSESVTVSSNFDSLIQSPRRNG